MKALYRTPGACRPILIVAAALVVLLWGTAPVRTLSFAAPSEDTSVGPHDTGRNEQSHDGALQRGTLNDAWHRAAPDFGYDPSDGLLSTLEAPEEDDAPLGTTRILLEHESHQQGMFIQSRGGTVASPLLQRQWLVGAGRPRGPPRVTT